MNELQHHGIPGMQWGVRNGPPYPLNDAGRKSFSDRLKEGRVQKKLKRAEKHVRKAQERMQKKIDEKERAEQAKIEKKVRKALSGKSSINNLSPKELELYVSYLNNRLKAMDLTLQTDRKMKEISENDKSTGQKMLDAQLADIGNNAIKPLITGFVALGTYAIAEKALSNIGKGKMTAEEKKEYERKTEKRMGIVFGRVNKAKK